MNKKDEGRASLFHSSNAVNIITIIVVTLVCIILVLLLAKGLFASNSKEVPAGLNTATLANSAAAASQTTTASVTSSSSVTSAAGGETTAAVTTEPRDDSVAYVVTYVQLKAQPNQDAANVVCMSPNIKVKILERREDGYVQLTFLNGDGTNCTGYVKTEYLSPTPVERTTAAETAPAETEQPSSAVTTAVSESASQTTETSRSNNALIETAAQ